MPSSFADYDTLNHAVIRSCRLSSRLEHPCRARSFPFAGSVVDEADFLYAFIRTARFSFCSFSISSSLISAFGFFTMKRHGHPPPSGVIFPRHVRYLLATPGCALSRTPARRGSCSRRRSTDHVPFMAVATSRGWDKRVFIILPRSPERYCSFLRTARGAPRFPQNPPNTCGAGRRHISRPQRPAAQRRCEGPGRSPRNTVKTGKPHESDGSHVHVVEFQKVTRALYLVMPEYVFHLYALSLKVRMSSGAPWRPPPLHVSRARGPSLSMPGTQHRSSVQRRAPTS